MRYFVCLSYDGAPFCGWQIQPGAPSVQESLEVALSRLLGRRIAVTGAGRTDTAVNASHYVVHFDLDGVLPFEASDFIYKLNAILPREIAVFEKSPPPSEKQQPINEERSLLISSSSHRNHFFVVTFFTALHFENPFDPLYRTQI